MPLLCLEDRLGRKMFLSAEKQCFYAWYEYHMEWQNFKAEEATTIQCFWRCVMAEKNQASRKKSFRG